ELGAGLTTDLPDEPLMLLVGLSAWMMFLWKRPQQVWRLHPLLAVVLLQLVWSAGTVLTSTQPAYSLKYILAKSWYLSAFVLAPVLFWKKEKILRRSVIVLMVSMLVCT